MREEVYDNQAGNLLTNHTKNHVILILANLEIVIILPKHGLISKQNLNNLKLFWHFSKLISHQSVIH